MKKPAQLACVLGLGHVSRCLGQPRLACSGILFQIKSWTMSLEKNLNIFVWPHQMGMADQRSFQSQRTVVITINNRTRHLTSTNLSATVASTPCQFHRYTLDTANLHFIWAPGLRWPKLPQRTFKPVILAAS